MKDFLKKVEYIKLAFSMNRCEELSAELLAVQLALGTPGEVFAGIAYNLNKIKVENLVAYNLVKKEIDEIIEYAKSINYLQELS